MRVGVISGSGVGTWPGLVGARERTVTTRYGEATVTCGRIGAIEVVHLARHGAQHERLSHHVDHRANLAALIECQVECLINLTICGAVDPAAELGSLIVFDDLYFPDNRLPDGSPCTWHDTPGTVGRGHWIFEEPFSPPLREHSVRAAQIVGAPVLDGGCYGHVWGPRFNSRTEIAALARLGVTAVSQTAGPEIVLAGEAELPTVTLGYLTDFANGASRTAEPIEALVTRMGASRTVFAEVVETILARLEGQDPPSKAGTVYRFAP